MKITSATDKIERNTEKINKVELNMAEIKTDISYIKDSQEKMSNKLDAFIEAIHKSRESDKKNYDNKYASKPTEWIVYALVALILIAVFTSILTGVLI